MEHHKSELCLRRRCCLSAWYLDWPLLGCGVCLSANPQISNREHSAESQLTRGEMKYYLLHCIQLLPQEPHQRLGLSPASHRVLSASSHHPGVLSCSGASLCASTMVCAWAVCFHLFDQQTQNLAHPHHVLTPVPVYPWCCPFLLPLLALSGKTSVKPHRGKCQKRKHAAPISFYQLHFPQCCFILSLKHCSVC